MKRLLCILSGMNAGGAETFLMKIYRQIDKSKYQMDFCVNTPEKCFYEDEIVSYGGKIYRIPEKSLSVKKFKSQLYDIVKSNDYKYVLRICSNSFGFMDLKIAYKAGAKICAVRSSNSSDGGSLKAVIAHKLGRILYGRYVNVRIAPSDLAAKYTFGNKAYKNGLVNILHNGIDLKQYEFSPEKRIGIRSEFNIPEDTTVIGHVGRFMTQKNHLFLLDVFKNYCDKNSNSVLLLVGKGDLEDDIKRKAKELDIFDRVIFTGVRSDVPALLPAMDVFVFPSLYEGMPNTVIEAQATGLPCVISDTITREANITGLVTYLPLNLSSEEWANNVVKLLSTARKNTSKTFKDDGYDIESVTDTFVNLVFDKQNEKG